VNQPIKERTVSCPICLERFVWSEEHLLEYVRRSGTYEPVDLAGVSNPARRKDIRSRSYVRCPDVSTTAHYLPAIYGDYPDPVVIGLVGRPLCGKSHLLAAMIDELINGHASQYGISAFVADHILHNDYRRNQLEPFLRGEQLSGSEPRLIGIAEWLLVGNGSSLRPVVFFDVAGEDLKNPGDKGLNARFLLSADALLFVEDAAHVVPDVAEPIDIENAEISGDGQGNEWVREALNRLGNSGRDYPRLPAAVVLSKADRLRYVPPVDRWIRDQDADLRPARVLAETRDVFALFDRWGVNQMTDLYRKFQHCTMHVASATGVAVADKRYPRGVRPSRVLRPLVTLLATLGVVRLPDTNGAGG
jgi:hypothetical protein